MEDVNVADADAQVEAIIVKEEVWLVDNNEAQGAGGDQQVVDEKPVSHSWRSGRLRPSSKRQSRQPEMESDLDSDSEDDEDDVEMDVPKKRRKSNQGKASISKSHQKKSVPRKRIPAKKRKKSLSSERMTVEEKRENNRRQLAERRARMTEEEKQKIREENRKRVAAKRAAMSEKERLKFREEGRKRMAAKRAAMPVEEKLKIQQQNRERHKAKAKLGNARESGRLLAKAKVKHDKPDPAEFETKIKRYIEHQIKKAQLTEEEREEFRRNKYLRRAIRRLKETPQEREDRLSRQRMKYLIWRANMSEEELLEYREKHRIKHMKIRESGKYPRKSVPWSEWPEEKKQKHRLYYLERLKHETPEQKHERLEKYKINQRRNIELKKLMKSEGLEREEAKAILKAKHPEFYPPRKVPRGRPVGSVTKNIPYRPRVVPRKEGRGRPPSWSNVGFGQYLVTEENGDQDLDSRDSNVDIGESSSSQNMPMSCPNTNTYESTSQAQTNASKGVQSFSGCFPSTFASETTLNTSSKETTVELENVMVESDLHSPFGNSFPAHHSGTSSPVENTELTSEDEITTSDIKLVQRTSQEAAEDITNMDDKNNNNSNNNGSDHSDSPSSSQVVKQRKKIHNDCGDYCCHLCGKNYRSKLYYIAHMSEEHADQSEKTITCPVNGCAMTFANPLSCRMHYNRVHADVLPERKRQSKYSTQKRKSLKCSMCGETFEMSAALAKHTKEVHSVDYRKIMDTKQTCPYCCKDFKQKATLDDHIRRVHLGMSNDCDLCGKGFQSPVKLWRHKVTFHGMKDLDPSTVGNIKVDLCAYCGEYIFRQMKSHVEKEHPEHYEEYLLSLEKDVRKSKKPTFYCEICKTEFVRSKDAHNKSKHPELVLELENKEDDRVSCDVCGKKVWTAKTLATHILHWHHRNIEFNWVQATDPQSLSQNDMTCIFCFREQQDRIMYKLHLIDNHSEELIQYVKKKVEEGTVLTSKELARLRNRRCASAKKKKNPSKGTASVLAKRERESKNKREQTKILTPGNQGRSKRVWTQLQQNTSGSCKRQKRRTENLLVKDCGRKINEPISLEDKNLLERFPDIKWGCPVVTIKLLNESEISVLSSRITKTQELLKEIKPEIVEFKQEEEIKKDVEFLI